MVAFSLPFRPRPFSPVPYQPSFFHFFLVLLRVFSFLFLSAAGALLWLVLAVDKRVRPGKAREAKLLWLAAPSGPIALLHIGLKRDVRHPAAAQQPPLARRTANPKGEKDKLCRRRRTWAWTGRGLNPAPLAC